MTTSPLFKRPLRNGWFSMESAPRTGETIMLYESGRGVFEGWWKQTEYEAYWMDLQDSEPDPVAWRPILPGPHEVVAAPPEPPADEAEHFIKCDACGGWIGCRDLGSVFDHEGPLPHPSEDQAQ